MESIFNVILGVLYNKIIIKIIKCILYDIYFICVVYFGNLSLEIYNGMICVLWQYILKYQYLYFVLYTLYCNMWYDIYVI